jgi:hypothetical protein
MANAFSVFRARQGWIDPTDQDFTLKALMFKQQKYDANQAKVQSIIDKYQSLQVARGVDKEYLNSKLSQLVGSANALGPQDLSSNAVTSSITNHLGQVLDDNVMTAIGETAKIRNYQNEMAQIKEKHPELYNPLNEAYGLAPAQQYLQSSDLGAKIQGNLSYTPYQDVEGDVNKFLMEIQKNSKDGVTMMPNPNAPGQMIEVTLNGKSANELRQIAMGYIGNRYDNQLKINTWGGTNGFRDIESRLEPTLTGYTNLINQKSKELADAKSRLTGNLTAEEKSALQDQVKSLENEVLSASSMRDGIERDPVSSLVFLEKEKIANRSGLALGMLQTRSVEYKKDDYYFSVLDNAREDRKEAFDIQKYNNDTAIKSRELELREMEIGIKAAKGSKDSDSDSTSSGGTSNLTNLILEDTNPAEALPEQLESAHNSWKQSISDKYQAQNNFARQIMNTVNDIASGRNRAVNEDQRQAAIAAVNQFKQNGGKMDTMSAAQAQNFMKLMSRADAFSALDFLPVDNGRLVQVKQTYTDLFNDWSQSANGYRNAKAQAQKAEASGMKRGFASNEMFVETAKKLAPGIYTDRVANAVVTKKNKGELQTLISMSDEAKGSAEVPILEDDSAFKIKDLKNGKFEITYFSKSKDSDKNNVIVPNTVTVAKENAYRIIPSLSQGRTEEDRYRLATLGTKPLYSTNLKFLDANSTNYDNYVDTAKTFATTPYDLNFIDSNNAKQTIKQQLGITGLRKPEEREMMNSLVDTLLSDEVMSKYKTSVYFNHSAISSNGKGYISVVNKKGDKIATLNLGEKRSLDKEVKQNEWLPQINYSKVVGSELRKVLLNYQTTGKLELTPEIQKLLSNG